LQAGRRFFRRAGKRADDVLGASGDRQLVTADDVGGLPSRGNNITENQGSGPLDVITDRGGSDVSNTRGGVGSNSDIINGEIPRGARGPSSQSSFVTDPSKIGLRFIPGLSTDNVRITQAGIDRVIEHTSRFGDDVANTYMIDRLKQITLGEIQPTQTDLNFYTHKLREGLRFDRLQSRSKLPLDAKSLWELIHRPTVSEFGLVGKKVDFYLPEALRLEEEALAREFGLSF